MGILSFLKPRQSRDGNPLENPSVPLASPAIWGWLNHGQPTEAGELVNEVSALQLITVYSCVRVISESIASLPLKLYERLDKGRQEATDQALYELLAFQPNPEMTAFTFFETLTGCLALTGNCYAQIVRNTGGQAMALYPLHPLKTEPIRFPTGDLGYRTSDGEANGNWRTLKSEDVLHIPLWCFDGLKGLSPIAQARQGLGLTRAAEKFGARFFGNGSKAGGVLSTESNIDEKQAQAVRESWQATQGGVNQGKIAVLPGKWTYQQIGISPEDSQFLQTRQYQRTEIAALFRIPPHMIGDTSRMSNNNAEQQNLSFVTDTLRPYLCRFEQEIIRKLMPSTGRNAGKYFVQFDVSERLRGDFKTQAEGFAAGRQWGWYSANDVLRELGRNPIGPVGDTYMYPVNNGNAEALLEPNAKLMPASVKQAPASQTAPAPTETERGLLAQYTPAYIHLFRDAVGRVCKRDKRDSETISLAFVPVLAAISEQISDVARVQFRLTPAWEPGVDKLIHDHLKSVEKRAADWAAEKLEEIAGMELSKAVRALHIAIFKDAGATLAIKEHRNE